MIDTNDKQEIEKLIKHHLRTDFGRKIGDTPTDDLQLVNKKYVDDEVAGVSTNLYPGYVNSNGTVGTPFPTGWSSSLVGTGNYTITHNLGAANYALTGMVDSTTASFCQINGRSANTVDVFIFDHAGNQRNDAFMFILSQ